MNYETQLSIPFSNCIRNHNKVDPYEYTVTSYRVQNRCRVLMHSNNSFKCYKRLTERSRETRAPFTLLTPMLV